jgi:hypothetical protein
LPLLKSLKLVLGLKKLKEKDNNSYKENIINSLKTYKLTLKVIENIKTVLMLLTLLLKNKLIILIFNKKMMKI